MQTMTYEADINMTAERHLGAAQGVLAALGLEKTLDPGPFTSRHNKQDKAQGYHEKVSNWRAFCAEARAAGKIEMLFEYD